MNKLSVLLLMSFIAIGACGDDDNPPPPANGPTETADFQVRCHIAGLGQDLLIPIAASITMSDPLAASVPVTATVDASATLDQMLGDTIVGLMMGDTVTLAAMDATMAIAGADATSLDLTVGSVPDTIDFDVNDDGTGNENILNLDTGSVSVTSDGSPEMSFTMDSLAVSLTDVPLLSTLDIAVPSTNARCTDAATDCAMNEDCHGEDTGMVPAVEGWCAELPPGGLLIFCEFPSDGSNVVTFPVPTPVTP